LAIICGLAVLTAAVFLGWLYWVARKYGKLEKQDEDIK
jgi:hypothetical protein